MASEQGLEATSDGKAENETYNSLKSTDSDNNAEESRGKVSCKFMNMVLQNYEAVIFQKL